MDVDSLKGMALKYSMISVALVVLICIGLTERKADQSKKTTHVDAAKPMKRNAESPENDFVKQELGNLTSPFTRKTVLELNSIVARSLSAIESFDRTRRIETRDPDGLTGRYCELCELASEAKSDMSEASHRVRTSGERYNDEILTAMVHFVNDVDREIRDELRDFSELGVVDQG